VFNICLHYPWPASQSSPGYDYPVGGAIDRIMKEFQDMRIGFDVRNSPFGDLRDQGTDYSSGHHDFTLGDFCDGYVFQKHFTDYDGCTVDPLFITDKNFVEAVEYLPNPRLKKGAYRSPQQFLDDMQRRADFKKKYPDLE
jgi:hypothetical protein